MLAAIADSFSTMALYKSIYLFAYKTIQCSIIIINKRSRSPGRLMLSETMHHAGRGITKFLKLALQAVIV